MTTCRIWLKNYHNVERDGVGGVVTRDAESTTVNTADNLATFVAIKDRFLNNCLSVDPTLLMMIQNLTMIKMELKITSIRLTKHSSDTDEV